MSAALALAVAVALAGCGSTTYSYGRKLPPSGLRNRVMIAIQNPSTLTKGALSIVDAYYDIRSSHDGKTASFSVSGYSGALPASIQNMPEEQIGAVYGSGDNSFTLVNYQTEATSGTISGLQGSSSSIFVTHDQKYIFAANQTSHVLTVIDQSSSNSGDYYLNLPGVYKVSVNDGGTAALAFVQGSNYAYYPVKLTSAQTLLAAQGTGSWPKAAVDCEPQTTPIWCLMQAQSGNTDSYGFNYGTALTFDRPVKAIFSSDGGTAYVLNCGPECGGTSAGISILPVAPILFGMGKASGTLTATDVASSTNFVKVSGGASNALLSGTTLYVVGLENETVNGNKYWDGKLSVVDTSKLASGSSNPITKLVPISDGYPGYTSRMILADDNTLWIAMQKCTNGANYNEPGTYNSGYGCLTMFNTSTNTVTMLESYLGDATGVAAVIGLNKVYAAIGGQVYIYKTADGSSIDNEYVQVNGTAYDVAYMDGTSDSSNTVY